MNKPRKTNIIKALKNELDFYKKRPIKPHIVNGQLQHLRIKAAFSQNEVFNMPKDHISEILIMRIVRSFENSIMKFPIETEYNENLGIYTAYIDLWINTKKVR